MERDDDKNTCGKNIAVSQFNPGAGWCGAPAGETHMFLQHPNIALSQLLKSVMPLPRKLKKLVAIAFSGKHDYRKNVQ